VAVVGVGVVVVARVVVTDPVAVVAAGAAVVVDDAEVDASGTAVGVVVVADGSAAARGSASTPCASANFVVPSRPPHAHAVAEAVVVVPRLAARAVAVPGPLLDHAATAIPVPASRPSRAASASSASRRLTACSPR
jgi:hypothetical protein